MVRATILAVTCAVAVVSARGNDYAMQRLGEWVVAVNEHAAGERDEALERIAAWTYDDLEMVLPYVEALTDVPVDTDDRRQRRRWLNGNDLVVIKRRTVELRARGDFDTLRQRAALLHTDAALLASPPVLVDRPSNSQTRNGARTRRRIDVMSADGQVERYQLANPHWIFARSILVSLPRSADSTAFVGLWYRATGAHFILERAFAEALDHFSAARAVVPDDPDVLYGEACLHEVLGTPRIQDYVRVAFQTGVSIRGVGSRASHFRRAETMLRKALIARPDFSEARLRLGRVLSELANHGEAVTHLEQVVRSTKNAGLAYYAHLFLGDVMLALGRPADARASYDRARDLFPHAQAAHLGLGAALRLMGDRRSALEAVIATTTLDPGARHERDEPWWTYYDGDEAGVNAMLGELRAPFREASK